MTTNLLLSGGPTHDLAATSAALADLLALEGIESVIVDDPHLAIERLVDPGATWDLVTVNAMRWRMEVERYAHLRDDWSFTLTPAEGQALAAHVAGGGGLLAMHTAVLCFDADPAWHATVGATWDWDRSSHPPVDQITVSITDAGQDHPITTGLEPFSIVDEAYGFLHQEPDLVPLLTADHGGGTHPLLWTRSIGAGRVVTDLLGHDASSLAHETHAHIIRRAARWILPQPGQDRP